MPVEIVGTWGTPVASNSAATAYSITGATVPADCTALIVGIGFQGTGNPSSVVWDPATINEALTLGPTNNDGTVQTAIYYKLNPTAGSSKSITATWGSNRSAVGMACTMWKGSDSIGSTNSGASSGTPSLTLTCGLGDVGIDYLAAAANPTLGGSQYSYHDGAPGGANMTNADGSYEFRVSGANFVTLNWTLGTFYVNAALQLIGTLGLTDQDSGSLRYPSLWVPLAASNR